MDYEFYIFNQQQQKCIFTLKYEWYHSVADLRTIFCPARTVFSGAFLLVAEGSKNISNAKIFLGRAACIPVDQQYEQEPPVEEWNHAVA